MATATLNARPTPAGIETNQRFFCSYAFLQCGLFAENDSEVAQFIHFHGASCALRGFSFWS
jgi:hypothetical protein